MSSTAQRLQALSRPIAAKRIQTIPQAGLIGALAVYRKTISPLYGQVCRFFPSCSAYALEAVTVHGAAKGSWLAARRLGRCHPWNPGGVDHVPASPAFDLWLQENPARIPRIIELNHPVIPADDEGREAA
ncbi:membrane protein insertion efficiency factor YidD [Arthrobacter sulfonylureivorans]|uniref:Putative membrane protein insertion efficiency factor n=2 Tax=Arthrobacter sulfonylureivorans TaxID=2486855 RepID=A0ABY3WBI0_9MICC|nr:membrane protein insertion efficiency factor YidD [Arthrobacter sulfonylureivorans]UNK47729.1 membrane protein insertion efficiency factor YidD [Arthrobacter sulfonylureivorans]